jgi:hypothetical protein
MQNPRKTMLVCFFTLMNLVPLLSADLAQELLPELAAPAAKHKAATEALDKQKQEAIAVAAKSYVNALDLIEKSATAKGEIDLVAEVVKEREAAASGTLEPNLPAALPKARLQMSRKTLLTSIERINTDFAKRRKQADAEYLRALASLDAKAASNPELAKQVAAEKTALLAGGGSAAGSGGAAAKVSRGKNVVVNGDFEMIGADGKPEGWDWASGIGHMVENNNTFIRTVQPVKYRDGSVGALHARQKVRVPESATKVSLSVRMRTAEAKLVANKSVAQAQIEFMNKTGEHVSVLQATWDGKNGGWKTYRVSNDLPEGGVEGVIKITNGNCPGQIDFDDIEVTFK